ncbi:cinnamate beta-D-glucosyltransferase-like [Oryza brachyantha]|uniref:cinnamate beta-D-glucosyltransferase-like n=1 Tax=Oryza brachyantha TaxID=4533 RepID=UPI001ADADC57|nr:cinnamate beta-D-glucosyltransferase-like [Oryza brachyantha]
MEPHVLLVSFPMQGHVNPLLRLGRRLAARGLLVTFSTVRLPGLRDVPEDGACADVGLGRLRFEYMRDGGGSRSYMAPDDMLSHVAAVGPPALAELVGRQADAGRPVTFVVNNIFVPWALDVAAGIGIPCAMLWIQPCSVLSIYYHFYKSPEAFFPTAAEPDVRVALPGLPVMAMDDMPYMVRPEFAQSLWGETIRAQVGAIQKTVSWVLVNSFDALERSALEALRAHTPVKLMPIGPLLEHDHDDGEDDALAQAPVAEDDDGCIAWLDAQLPHSVVYVAFGSLVNIGRDETAAMAEGLVATERPFLWVVRDDSRELIPEAVLEACSDRGKVTAWSPQGRVLRHGAVGCFVTHCGWNSIMEALAAGVPVVGYPWWSDQHTNAKFLVEDYKVGVRLPAPVAGDELRAFVDRVMSGPEAAVLKRRAMDWKREAAAAVADGGSSDRSLQDFVDHVRRSSRSVELARLAQEIEIINGPVNPVLV